MEIKDLDEWSTREEVAVAMAKVTGNNSDAFKVVSLRRHLGGSQYALVLAPLGDARKTLTVERLKVGMVSCRVRLCEGKIRC